MFQNNPLFGPTFASVVLVASACHDVERHDVGSTASSVTSSAISASATARASPSAAPAVHLSLCDELCAHSEPLHCKEASKCGEHCRDMNQIPVCKSEIAAAFACFVKLPSSGWECDEDGTPSVKDGHCESEQAAVEKCLSAAQVKP